MNTLFITAALFAALEAFRRPTRTTFGLAGLLLGVAVGHRNLDVFYLAPLPVLLEVARRRARLSPSLDLYGLGTLFLTAVVYLYLPIAARRDPYLAMGGPTSWSRFFAIVSAQAYFRHLATASAATDFQRALAFARDLPGNVSLSLLAAPIGFAILWRRRELETLIPIAWLALSCFCFSICYNVLDIDSYFIPSYLAIAVAAGIGFDAWRGKWQTLLPIVALVGLPIAFSSVTLHHTTAARDYGRQLVASAPNGAIVISFSDTETHVLEYVQGVENQRADMIVVSANEIADWYVQQLSRRYPSVTWPPARIADSWLTTFIVSNERDRPICLTQPLDMGDPTWKRVPVGLLYCLKQGSTSEDLRRSIAFWRTATIPSELELHHAEVHVQMIAFAFALARFELARALAEDGDLAEARSQLTSVVAARPDALERAIVASMRSIGRDDHRDLALERRAQLALQLEPHDPRLLQLLRL